MKIAILTPGGVDRSGTERVIPCLLWLIERLVQRGHEVHVFALNQEPSPARWALLGATVHNAGRRPRTWHTLLTLLREHRNARFDMLHAFWAHGPGLAGAIAARLLALPLVLTLPGGDLADHKRIGFGGRRRLRDRVRLRVATAGASVLTVPSEAIRRDANALGLQTLRVPLGVALDRWPPLAPRPRDPAQPMQLLHVASLNPVKDQATLLKATAELDAMGVGFLLDIVGCDTMNGGAERLARDLNLGDQVRFHGFLRHADLRPSFEQADLLVVSSIHEAGPLVALEAAVAGVPTVGTDVGHIADWAPEAAAVVPIGDHGALAAAIAALARDEPERLRMAAAAQALAVRENADFTASQFLDIYGDLVSQGRRNHPVSGGVQLATRRPA